MINFKKGTGHSLQQSDRVGKAKTGEAVVAGMVVRINTSGEVVKGPTNAAAADDILGFAINSQTDGDVIASNKIGYLVLDGNSVIETDQVTGTVNYTNFPLGSRVSADDSALGMVKAWESGERVIGYVHEIRNLQSLVSITQNYVDLDGNTVANTISTQKMIPCLGIKLAV